MRENPNRDYRGITYRLAAAAGLVALVVLLILSFSDDTFEIFWSSPFERTRESFEEDKEAAIHDAVKAAEEEKEAAIQAAVKAVEEEKEAAIQAAVKAVEEGKEAAIKKAVKAALNVEECRDVFKTKGKGGHGEGKIERILKQCEMRYVFNVCDDLRNFTGLANDEFNRRLARHGRFHFEAEHQFWNPTSSTELAWYYATSVDYLFANALHGVWKFKIDKVASKEYEPVLDYSGGVGNNVLYLAKKGIKVHYFGIGMAEYQFAQYRVWKHGLEDMVEFKKPFSNKTGYAFDPINGPLPRDGSLGSIIAMDVFEHIPNYHLVVEAMVESLRVGGIIIEVSPFAAKDVQKGEDDVRVHLSDGGIPMEEAMGPKMKKDGAKWKKVAE